MDDAFVIERTFYTPTATVWKALTNKDEMKKWYFDLAEFKPVKGFEFQFEGGLEERKYFHSCKVMDVILEKKISYTWMYIGYEGNSLVIFELFGEKDKTLLRLTHEGLDTFPKNNPDFAKSRFAEGWTYIVGTSLKEYLANK
jgi:uncharacterized protein YndB with AHSA1/START domain